MHFSYLDGIRGLAALYVAIFHSYQMQLFLTEALDPGRSRLFLFLKPLCMGHYAVTVFIVLSGYCLMLPIARAGAPYPLRGGFFGFFKRRARRILPAFYAAVIFTVVLLPFTKHTWGVVHAEGDPQIRSALNPPDTMSLLSEIGAHLLLINNGVPIAVPDLVKLSNNTPFWSVATEWQIYFLFPAVLLPMLRRFGPWVSMGTGVALGAAFSVVLGGQYALACPWMLGVFALGMFGAMITHSPDPKHVGLRWRIPWGTICVLSLVTFVIVGVTNLGLYRDYPIVADTFLGFGTMAGLVSLAGASERRRTPVERFLVDAFSASPARWLGACSYSLYLLHYPLLILSQAVLIRLFPKNLYIVDFAMLVPVMVAIVGLAYLFSLAFERPFMSSRKKRVPAVEDPSPAIRAGANKFATHA